MRRHIDWIGYETMTEEQKALLRKAAAQILAEPQLYDQGSFGYKAECGTVCCMAGHIAIAAGYRHTAYNGHYERGAESFRWADDIANVEIPYLRNFQDVHSRIEIFGYGDRWPEPYADQFQKAKTHVERAEVAARFLNDIADGKLESGE